MTSRPAPAIRDAAVASVVTLVLLGAATALLDAPGPPFDVIEPVTRMSLVRLDPGTFEMGSRAGEADRRDDEAAHLVTLTKVVYLGRHEVTQAEWATIMGGHPSPDAPCDACPVDRVDFYQVSEFISGLNARSTSMRFRLPTEAEWEYACDALAPPLPEPVEPAGRPTRVGRCGPGLTDVCGMHGNVAEWVNDWYGDYPLDPATDPRGPTAGMRRVVRGGSFATGPVGARCAARSSLPPQDSRPSVGFRLVGEPIVEEDGDRPSGGR